MSSFNLQPEETDNNAVLEKARELAIAYRHNLIDHTHLFVALLNMDCLAAEYCKDIDAEKWLKWLELQYPAEGYTTEDGFLPLTVSAGNVIRHCSDILTNVNDEPFYTSIHLLLALLCLDTEITEDFSRAGIIFENLAEKYYGKTVARSFPELEIKSYRAYSGWAKFFMSKTRKVKNLSQLYYLTLDLLNYRRNEEAIKICNRALSLEPANASFDYLRLIGYLRLRDFETALSLAQSHKEKFPETMGMDLTLATTYSESGMYEEADRLFTILRETSPDDYIVFNNSGFCLYLQQRYKEAIPHYERAIVLNPEFAYAYDNLGFVLHKTGQTEEGLALINKALEMDKGNSYAYKYKGIVLMETGNKVEALMNFQLALKFDYTYRYGNEVNEWIKKANIG